MKTASNISNIIGKTPKKNISELLKTSKKLEIIKYIILLCLMVLGFGIISLTARNVPLSGGVGNKGGGNGPVSSAGCAPATAIATLELNNIRARVEGTGGSMWMDRPNGIAAYNVPKQKTADDPRYTSIFAGSLWMGGRDVNGQLKLAAVTFRASGNDFWPGPLKLANADIDAATCSKFDEFFGVSRSMIDLFVAWYQAGQDDIINGTTTQIDNFPGYQIPEAILNWPAHGGPGEDWHLAPFYDKDGDDFYDPTQGDYPKYDLIGDIDCRTTRDIRLFGDTTIWFVFNDKGNVHSESGGPSIGMEIRGQAFAFATNDEVNNMTFYNYEMINRSTFTLTETFFGQWVDSDLGNAEDDYVGCDAQRGLGYSYNGDAIDEDNQSALGYGSTPPAIGVDFFEGPYMDNDGIDNPLTLVVQDAIDSLGIPYGGLGLGYGDDIVDNERYGMRKFIYYNRGSGQFPGDGDPVNALQHYNYLKGIWRDGAQMVWGGNGHPSSGGTIPADLLFPGDSDPVDWSTLGVPPTPVPWSEFNAQAGGTPNTPFDRRFLQSAGPFTLEPGAVNDLTVGVVWARASTGNNLASIQDLKVADDKAQALFDNCFKIAEGPDAPDLTFQELDRELILYLSNKPTSNNHNEEYYLIDPFIAIPDTMDGVYQGTDDDKDTLRYYDFQGYQIFQVSNASVGVEELYNPEVSRLAAQVDIKDGVTQLVNYTYDKGINANIPQEMVNGGDKGIKHSFRLTTDLFASGDNRLVNHKTYYYIAIAYGYNSFKDYDPNDPLSLDGQKKPYIASRKTGSGGGITSFAAIPHNPAPEAGGTYANSVYGDQPQITRVEGQGNGGNRLYLTTSTEARIVANNFDDFLVYEKGFGPINVKVVDPLNVQAGAYRVQFSDTTTPGNLTDARWTLYAPNGDIIKSDQTIAMENEQVILKHGISISIVQAKNAGEEAELGNGALISSVAYADGSKQWLTGFRDVEGQTDANWIRSGTDLFAPSGSDPYDDYSLVPQDVSNSTGFVDPNQDFEGIAGGLWAPYRLVSYISDANTQLDAVGLGLLSGNSVKRSSLINVPSVDIVFTADKSKWSRAMVLEAQAQTGLAQGGVKHLHLRNSASVDKNGNPDGTGTGMGWFPGYAINVETGERLNIAFAEDSWLAGENGRDMLWNPTSNAYAGVNNEVRMGGKHYVYVFRGGNVPAPVGSLPTYDGCAALANIMRNGPDLNRMLAFSSCVWAGIPMLAEGQTLLSTTAKVSLRVSRKYNSFTTASTTNNGLPMYGFDMTGFETIKGNADLLKDSVLSMINVVPNPYYANSAYETGKLDNRIKIINLPEECKISIYNVNGTLMRRFNKADPKTSLDWDLKNFADVPVAGGVYLIHVDVPNIGQRTLKWFGVIKPTDLNGF
jgi:hypothetical protein